MNRFIPPLPINYAYRIDRAEINKFPFLHSLGRLRHHIAHGAGRPQDAADLANAAVRSRARGIPLAMSDDAAGFIGSG
jgi:hypothetical protein